MSFKTTTRSLVLGGSTSLLAIMAAGLFASAAAAQALPAPTPGGPLPQGASTDGAAAVTADQATPPNPAEPTSPTAAPRSDAPGDSGGQEIVVTGSRIAKQDYQSSSPIVTANETLLKQSGADAITANLNKLPQFTPTARTPQAAGGDIQPTATNTPGANQISLRGLGSNRNLVLFDGRRGTPSDATQVIDINTIPTIAIERVEIITGGASSTYGADAVSGVVNFILKKNFSGLQFDASNSISQRGDGNEYQIAGIVGANFADNRGNVTFALSTNQRQGSFQIDRPWYRKLYASPTVPSNQFFPPFGGYYTGFANLPSAAALNANIRGGRFTGSPLGTTIYSDFSGNIFSGFDATGVPGVSGFNGVNGTGFKNLANGQLGVNRLNTFLIYPLTRYNMYARGTYEITDNLSVFGQGLFSKVHTFTQQEPSPIVTGWAVTVDPTRNRGVIPSGLLNILNSRTRPVVAGEAGFIAPTAANPTPVQPTVSVANAPFQLSGYLPFPRTSSSDVYNYNFVTGVQGKVPSINWTYEAFVSRGESQTTVTQAGFASLQRLTAIITLPNFGAGFDSANPATYAPYNGGILYSNLGAPNNGFGASRATCTSGINLFNPSSISQDCLNAIRADIKTKSTMRQTVWEGDATGPLFRLPAGEVKLAVGASYRSNDYSFQNDTLTTQGESFIEQAVGLYPSGNSSGRIVAKEAYGELDIPIIGDLPFVKLLDVTLGGRYSHYNTTGTSWTYKAEGTYQVNDWLRFRGGYNRAERTPNIAELFLSPQQTFAAASGGDVCSLNNQLRYSANPATNANYARAIALCGQLMERSGTASADDNYYGVDYRTLVAAPASGVKALATQPQASGASFVFPTLQGNANLTPETAKTITAGAVISSPWKTALLSRLRLSVDYYNIKVNHAIAPQSPDILQRQCFDPAFNPNYDVNSTYCAGVNRNATGALGNLIETYFNNGRFRTSGIDVQVDWGFQAGPGTVSLNSVFNYLLHTKAAELASDGLVEYRGTLGPTINGLDGNSYKYKVLTTVGYTIGGLYLGVQWKHLPSIRSVTSALIPTTTVTGVTKSYDLFNLQGNVSVTRDVAFRFGVDNLADRAPPISGVNTGAVLPSLPGGSYDAINYDVFGRRFYVGANFKF